MTSSPTSSQSVVSSSTTPERQNLLRIAAQGDPDQTVLAPEHVRDRRPGDHPAGADPGSLFVALRQSGRDRSEPVEDGRGDSGAFTHGGAHP